MAATRFLVAALLALVPACGSSGSTTTVVVEDDPVDETVAAGEARGAALADRSFDELFGNDYLVQVGMTGEILATINDGEIQQADFAAQVVLEDDVFAFANDLLIDHEDANVDLDGVVRFYGVGYIPSNTANEVAAEASANFGVLRGSPPGDVDFRFVEMQVEQHAAALVLLDELYNIVGDGEMGDFILDTSDMIDFHLTVSADLLATFY